MHQLVPQANLPVADAYRGPVSMMRRAFEATESLGSLTVVLAIMDNSTQIHGKLHPMIAIITVGDCELLVLRRVQGTRSLLELVCHTEMQRIDGHAQTPLQLARVDDRIDPNFNEELTIEVIERGSAVNCVSAYEGDIVIMGSDGVFDNLFLDEILELANQMLPPQAAGYPEAALRSLAQAIVEQCHAKTRPLPNGQLAEAPIGRGGKKDDTSCVVAEVVEWTREMQKIWTPKQQPWPQSWFGSVGSWFDMNACCGASPDSDDDVTFRKPSKQKENGWTDVAASHVAASQQYQPNSRPQTTQQAYPGTVSRPEYQVNQGPAYPGQTPGIYQGAQAYQANPYPQYGQANYGQGYQAYQGYQGNYPTPYQGQAYQAYQDMQQPHSQSGYPSYPQAQYSLSQPAMSAMNVPSSYGSQGYGGYTGQSYGNYASYSGYGRY